MKNSMLRFAVPAFCLIAAQLPGQTTPAPASTTPSYTQSLSYIKVAPGKSNEYLQLTRDVSMKTAQVRADAGEIVSWSLLRSVFPAGEEARANYVISIISEGSPKSAGSRSAFEEQLKKAGVTMSATEYYAKRGSITTLVASELWRIRERVGAPAKGHYLFLNSMRVHDAAAYNDFESNVWRPLAAERIKRGEMSGWIFATKMMPSGSDTVYTAYSADIYPSYEAAFKRTSSTQEVFAAAHPGKNYEQTMLGYTKLRDLAKREMWVVVERIEKTKK